MGEKKQEWELYIIICLVTDLKLFQACILSFMKFSPHSAKIHWLFDNSVVGLHLSMKD